jgi:broad specificity phosphatase PhoE
VTPLRLVLARHGQTTANSQHILDTRLPGHPLTEAGHQQAADLAQRLADEAVVAVYASRAVRARQTAQPIAARHQLTVQILDGVHEVFIGDLEGCRTPEDHHTLHELYRTWHYGDLEASRPGSESGKQVLERYLADVAAIRRAHWGGGTAVLVSHGAATRLAVVALAANVEGSFAAPRLLPNAATVLLEADGTGWRCLRWDGIELG